MFVSTLLVSSERFEIYLKSLLWLNAYHAVIHFMETWQNIKAKKRWISHIKCSLFVVTVCIQMCVWLCDISLPLHPPVNVNLSSGAYSPLWPFPLLTPSSLLPRCWDLLPETCSLWFCHQLCINNNNHGQLLICNDTFITTAAAYNSLVHISY